MTAIWKKLKKILLYIWREFPFPEWIKDSFLFLINHKFIIGVLAVILDKKGRIMLFRHTYIKNTPWGLPGGAAKKEDLKIALVREIKEESNFIIRIDKLIGIAQRKRQIDFLFKCSIIGDEFRASEEVNSFKYFSFDEKPNVVNKHKAILDCLRKFKNSSGNPIYIPL